jgi:deaminated glutathione amidase
VDDVKISSMFLILIISKEKIIPENMPKFLAAAIQLNSQPDLSESLNRTHRAISEASRKNAQFVALPENFPFMGDEREKQRQAESISEAVLEKIPKWAKTFGITILAGGFPVRAISGKVFNRAILVDPAGKVTARYDKIHLFDVELSAEESYRESETVEAGKPEPVVGEVSFDDDAPVNIGFSICYDIRFPELYRKLADRGADLICVPAAFTRPTGKAHWKTLLRARAIENSCFIIAPAQTGIHGTKRKTHGHSLIIDPWGRVLADAGTEPGMALAEIDTNVTDDVRRKLPSFRHKRL